MLGPTHPPRDGPRILTQLQSSEETVPGNGPASSRYEPAAAWQSDTVVPGPRLPIEPPATGWRFPPTTGLDRDGPLAVGADLEPGTLLEAYRHGYFPMPMADWGAMSWWSPDPRGVIELTDFHVSRSLRRSMRNFDISVNRAFD